MIGLNVSYKRSNSKPTNAIILWETSSLGIFKCFLDNYCTKVTVTWKFHTMAKSSLKTNDVKNVADWWNEHKMCKMLTIYKERTFFQLCKASVNCILCVCARVWELLSFFKFSVLGNSFVNVSANTCQPSCLTPHQNSIYFLRSCLQCQQCQKNRGLVTGG